MNLTHLKRYSFETFCGRDTERVGDWTSIKKNSNCKRCLSINRSEICKRRERRKLVHKAGKILVNLAEADKVSSPKCFLDDSVRKQISTGLSDMIRGALNGEKFIPRSLVESQVRGAIEHIDKNALTNAKETLEVLLGII